MAAAMSVVVHTTLFVTAAVFEYARVMSTVCSAVVTIVVVVVVVEC